MRASPQSLVIASRESRLALWQAEFVRSALGALYPSCSTRIEAMSTRGDRILDRALSKVGGKGLFIKELETALEEGRADLAVHSLKDVPMELPRGFVLAAVLKREDPRDAWVSNAYADVTDLPAGARVGSSSLRRAMQIRARRPDVTIVPVRGNVDTRLAKLDRGEVDALILAAAGLKRLGLATRIRAVLSTQDSLPSAGQGALAIEVLSQREELLEWLAPLGDVASTQAVMAERAVSRALSGSCETALAAYCEVQPDGQLWLRARLGAEDGSAMLMAQDRGTDPHALGLKVAHELLAQGAERYISGGAP